MTPTANSTGTNNTATNSTAANGASYILRGGTVVDGTGTAPYEADVALSGDRIVAISREELVAQDSTQVIDASGRIVAPGFIDIHTHYDAQVFWDPALTPSSFHGVTSVVAGNCGFSIAPVRPEHHDVITRTLEGVEDMSANTLRAGVPWDFETFGDYLRSVQQHGTALNFGAYVGHTALRLFVMGDDAYEREATEAEISKMCELLVESLAGATQPGKNQQGAQQNGQAGQPGACGFATSFAGTHRGIDGKPVPSRLASREEVERLFEAAASTRRGVIAIAPGEQVGIKDLYDLQPTAGIPFTYTALLTSPSGGWRDLMMRNREGWEDGVEVWPQVSPRPGTFQMTMLEPFALNPNPVFGALIGLSAEERLEAYADPQWRDKAEEGFKEQKILKPRWEVITIDESETHPELIGRPTSEVAEERGCRPLDVILDTAIDDKLATRVRTVFANDDKAGVAELLSEQHCTLGLSDAGAHVGQLCDAPQATDFLGKWVRDQELMPVETAVRKLSGQQADIFNLEGRGYLREGAFADVVVFDFETIGPGPTRRVRDFPANEERLTADAPTGIEHIFVNGVPISGELSVAGESGGDSQPWENSRPPGQLLVAQPRI